MIIATTPRLTLRQFQKGDLGALAAILSDPEVMRFSVTGPMSREQVATMLEHVEHSYRENGFGLWAVEHRSGLMIGYCGLITQDVDGRREIEIGYRLARNYWGGGLATEAARAARDYAFRQLGLTRIVSLITSDNIASIRVAEKNGMRLRKTTVKWDMDILVYMMEPGKSAPVTGSVRPVVR